ncbi:hypothetical protein DI396_13665 [Litorivita pollutaquae]|uniref:Uncharacterized protein n=1 Tax=Litorivita pollutaquae TaxID=2200892 RepID=A0A2V4NAX0_9RHOB|nr:hypothetical protein DI396_13665 [Litorivita pollutaquae]
MHVKRRPETLEIHPGVLPLLCSNIHRRSSTLTESKRYKVFAWHLGISGIFDESAATITCMGQSTQAATAE